MLKVRDKFIPDSLYREIVDNLPVCTVDVVLFNKEKNKVLLFKRLNKPVKGKYFSTGGRMFKNEDFSSAAVRLIKKELGIKLIKNKLFWGGVSSDVYSDSIYQGIGYHTIDIFWGYILDSTEKIVLDNQHSNFKWFSVDDKVLHPYMKNKIKILLNC